MGLLSQFRPHSILYLGQFITESKMFHYHDFVDNLPCVSLEASSFWVGGSSGLVSFGSAVGLAIVALE